jgi:hypothetical protein
MDKFQAFEIEPRPRIGLFSGLTAAAPGVVLVVDREGQELSVLRHSGDGLTAGRVRFDRIRTLYKVNVKEVPVQYDAVWPCSDDIGGFRGRLMFAYQITDPEAVVRRGIQDVRPVLMPTIERTMRQVCRRFSAEDHAAAEDAVTQALVEQEQGGGGIDPSFSLRNFAVSLELDDAAARYVRKKKDAERNEALSLRDAESRFAREQEDSLRQLEREKARAKLEAEKVALEASIAQENDRQAAARHQLRKERQALDAELNKAKMTFELELETLRESMRAEAEQRLALARLEFEKERQEKQAKIDQADALARRDRQQLILDQYASLLRDGEYGLVAIRLLQDPSSIAEVASQFAQRKDAADQRRLQTLDILLSNNALEGYDLTEEAKKVLRELVNSWSEDLRSLEATARGQSTDRARELTSQAEASDKPSSVPNEPSDADPSRVGPADNTFQEDDEGLASA